MKSGLFVAIAIFVTIYITLLDTVLKCCCQIVNGTLPYCHADVCHIWCHKIPLLHTSIEMCRQAHIKYVCVCVCFTCTCPCVCQICCGSIGHFYM